MYLKSFVIVAITDTDTDILIKVFVLEICAKN